MVYLVLCPICKDSTTHDKKPLGLAKCKACNSLFAPKPINQSNSTSPQVSFNIEFSESENEADSVNDVDESAKSTVEPVKDKRFLLEFSDSSDNEAPREPIRFTRTNEKKSFRRLSASEDDKETNKQKKKGAFKPLSDSEDDELPRTHKKSGFMPLSDSEDEFLPSTHKKKRTSKNLSESEYEDDGDDDEEEVLPEANTRQYRALFDSDDEPASSTRNRYKKTENNERKVIQGVLPKFDYDEDLFTKDIIPASKDDSLFSDADSLIEEEEKVEKPVRRKRKAPQRKKAKESPFSSSEEDIEIYHQGDLDKKPKKLKKPTAVPEVKLDENGQPIKKRRGRYRFAPKPGNKFNPYILFNKEYRNKLKEANPGIDSIALNKLVGKAYRELDPEKKERLLENSRRLAEQHQKQQKETEEIPETTVLKLPPDGFILFKETNKEKYIGEHNEGMSTNKYLTELWKRLPESEKEVYKTESRNRRQEFMIKHPIVYKELMNRKMTRNLASRRLNLKKNNKR